MGTTVLDSGHNFSIGDGVRWIVHTFKNTFLMGREEKTVQERLFNAMMARQTKLEIDRVEIEWKPVTGTVKERTKKAKRLSIDFAKLLES